MIKFAYIIINKLQLRQFIYNNTNKKNHIIEMRNNKRSYNKNKKIFKNKTINSYINS